MVFLFGWFLMKRLDQFLAENQKRIEEETVQQQKPCLRLNGDISPDELDEALSLFRSSHAHVEIVIYDSEATFISKQRIRLGAVETFTF